MQRQLTDEEKQQKGRLEFEIQRGMSMAGLIDNSMVKDTMTGLLHGIQNAWGLEEDAQKREILWHRFNAIKDLWSELNQFVETGKMAHHQLKGGNYDEENSNRS